MAGNTFGSLLRLTTFGESHGAAIGGILEGFPAGLEVDFSLIEKDMARRRPGQSSISTPRSEADQVEFLSGIFEGRSLGTPIAFLIRNKDTRSKDYDALKEVYRPSHADFSWEKKFGHRDHRGGGRSSARETAARVAGGALAKMLLAKYQVEILAWVSAVGPVEAMVDFNKVDEKQVEANVVRCPDAAAAKRMIDYIEQLKAEGDSTGGVITCLIKGIPAGLGEPVFDKLQADLAKAMLSINAVKGFDYGSGFAAAAMKGSEHNDAFATDEKEQVVTLTNRSGGIQGGISNGQPIYFRVAFKPVATIGSAQQTVNRDKENVTLEAKGRHDPCVVPRAVPIVEAMAALTLADHLLRNKTARL
ncbi:MAG: chorismate synthase [Bacteroidales bacterium]|nr:chorismate synthase [Bacteroidales bacterium]